MADRTDETVSLQAVLIKVAHDPSKPGISEFPGWIVPETDSLFAVDQRYEADIETMQPASWWITHLPTGRRVSAGLYTAATTRSNAFEIAQRFYREAIALGCDLKSKNIDEVTGGFKSLSQEQRTAVWERIADFHITRGGESQSSVPL